MCCVPTPILRAADNKRFTDADFKKIIAFAALGVPESAFKTLDAEDYWRIGLVGHEALRELDDLAPEITATIKDDLLKAPAPFKWLRDHNPDVVVRAFYLSVILEQHLPNWHLLLANIDPSLTSLGAVEAQVLRDAAPKLVALNSDQARQDLQEVEDGLDAKAIGLILVEQMGMSSPAAFATALEKERYSTLLRSLALLLALDNLLTPQPARKEQARVRAVLFPEGAVAANFVDSRPSPAWSSLKEAYRLAQEVQSIKDELTQVARLLSGQEDRGPDLHLLQGGMEWQTHQSAGILPISFGAPGQQQRPAAALPGRPAGDIRQGRGQYPEARGPDAHRCICPASRLNCAFQDMAPRNIPAGSRATPTYCSRASFYDAASSPTGTRRPKRRLSSSFDGMRYDIWDEMLRPMLEDRMDIIEDYPASSLLPSETHISRWALAAGANPSTYMFPHQRRKRSYWSLPSAASSG